jgi:hypothetical protein
LLRRPYLSKSYVVEASLEGLILGNPDNLQLSLPVVVATDFPVVGILFLLVL